MKKLLPPPQNRKSLLLAFVALLLPLSRPLAGLGVAAAFLHELFFFFSKGSKGHPASSKLKLSAPLKASILLFLLYLASLLYADDFFFGWHKLETKFCLLICPLLFGMNYTPSAGRYLPRAFVFGNLLAVFYSLAAAVFDTLRTGINHFHYMKLSEYLHLHPTVFSLYLFVSLFFLLNEWSRRPGKTSLRFWASRLALAFLFVVFILLLSARMAMMSGFLLLGLYLFILLYRHKGFLQSAVWMLLALLLSSAAAWSIPSTRYRLQVLLEGEGQGEKTSNVRWEIWDAATELIADAPPWGYGLGDVDSLLINKYEALDYCKPYGERYNAHNQYIQTLLAIGWPGLLVFLSMIFLALRQAQDIALRQAQGIALRQAQGIALRQAQDIALRQAQDTAFRQIQLRLRRSPLREDGESPSPPQPPFQGPPVLPALFFMLLLSINFLTESLLETQQSLIFFSLFYCFFFFFQPRD